MSTHVVKDGTLPRHQQPARFGRFLFGAPYYPEHWKPEDMERDAELMQAAGVNVVRLAEFAWDLMEPRRGEFNFSLYDEKIELLGKHGIDTILCTPTATPPRWLTEHHDGWMRVDTDGRKMLHGSRQHVCTNNPEFRGESVRITRAMAEHFADNPHVIGWQTDNEFHCHFSECYCPSCVQGFRDWLKDKYPDIATLNAAWGVAFWAQTYDNFEQIELPRLDRPTHPNPSQHLDYFRFLSDGISSFQREQVNILRAKQPRWWITHNGMFGHIDNWKFAEDLNFFGVDIYPGFAAPHPQGFSWASTLAEACRSASGSFIVPEQQGGGGGQRPYLLETPAPGQMRLWAYQSVAHGADGILHFRWRTARFGAEMYWNGIIDHDNVPRRRYREFAQEGEEFGRIGDKILGTTLWAQAAVLIEFDQDEAHPTMPLGLPSPNDQRKIAYREMLERHLPAGLVNAADSFDGLKLLLIPSFVLMDEELASRLRAFVENGGILVATARTATRNRNNHVIAQTPPGLLAELFGVTVEEFGKLATPLLKIQAGQTEIAAGAAYEILKPRGARVLATWAETTDGSLHAAPGTAAVTVHQFGQGKAIYIGTYFSEENVNALFDLIMAHSEIEALAETGQFVEVTRRRSAQCNLVFVLNHNGQASEVTGLPAGTDLLSGRACNGDWHLEPYGVAIIETNS